MELISLYRIPVTHHIGRKVRCGFILLMCNFAWNAYEIRTPGHQDGTEFEFPNNPLHESSIRSFRGTRSAGKLVQSQMATLVEVIYELQCRCIDLFIWLKFILSFFSTQKAARRCAETRSATETRRNPHLECGHSSRNILKGTIRFKVPDLGFTHL